MANSPQCDGNGVGLSPLQGGSIAVALRGSCGTVDGRLFEGPRDLWPDVVRAFASCEGHTVLIANALPRLHELHACFPVEFANALFRCADVILGAAELRAVRARSSAESAVELLAAAATHAELSENQQLAPRLRRKITDIMGGADGSAAPRDRYVRHRCAEVLWRLLAGVPLDSASAPQRTISRSAPVGHGSAASPEEAVLLRLCRDRAPLVRHAAVPGLALLRGSAAAFRALIALAGSDPTSRVRLAALAQLQPMLQDGVFVGCELLAPLFAGRALDASAPVRCRLYGTLASLDIVDPGCHFAVQLLCCGLRDGSPSVRTECHCMLRAWLDRVSCATGADSERALLELLSRLNEQTLGQCGEEAAEAALGYLLPRTEWQRVAESMMEKLLGFDSAMRPEEVFVARIALALDADTWSSRSGVSGPPVLQRTLRALDAGLGGVFELRQLLLVLARAEIADKQVGRSVLHIATAVLLRAPSEPQAPFVAASVGHVSPPSTFHLAVVVARRALGIRPGLRRTAAQRLEGQFSEAMLVILGALGGLPNREGETPLGSETTLDTLSAHLEVLVSEARSAEAVTAELRAERAQLTAARDYLSACSVRDKLAEAESRRRQAEGAVDSVAKELGMRSFHVLCVVEAMLSHSRADLAEDFSLSLLLEDVLRPAILRADRAPTPGAGGVSWPLVRALAVRCVALHATMSAETATQHWHFFTSVLTRFTPAALAPLAMGALDDPDGAGATVAVVEQCVLFLADSLFVCRDVDDGESVEQWSTASTAVQSGNNSVAGRVCEFFTIVAPLLGAPSSVCGSSDLSRSLRCKLAERICTLLLFGGMRASAQEQRDGVVISAGEDGCGASAIVPVVEPEMEPMPAGAHWALTWLLLEAFARRPPFSSPTSTQDGSLQVISDESTCGAMMRGRLLRFFGTLARLSPSHVGMLAAAAEGFLSLELWQLGSWVQIGVGQRWCSVPLPRLVRFLCRQLVAAKATGGNAPGDVAHCWLECLWRPLALACLENAAVSAASDAELPQCLLAAVAAVAPVDAGVRDVADMAFVPASLRATFVAEVAWVLNRAVELWGWNTVGGGTAGLAPSLLELRDRMMSSSAVASLAVDWALVYHHADQRRLRLRRSIAKLGVEVRSIVAKIVASLHLDKSVGDRLERNKGTQGATRRCTGQMPEARRQLNCVMPGAVVTKRNRGRKRAARFPNDSARGQGQPSKAKLIVSSASAASYSGNSIHGRTSLCEASKADRRMSRRRLQSAPFSDDASGHEVRVGPKGDQEDVLSLPISLATNVDRCSDQSFSAHGRGTPSMQSWGDVDYLVPRHARELAERQKRAWVDLRHETCSAAVRYEQAAVRLRAETLKRLEELASGVCAAAARLSETRSSEHIEDADDALQNAGLVGAEVQKLIERAQREVQSMHDMSGSF